MTVIRVPPKPMPATTIGDAPTGGVDGAAPPAVVPDAFVSATRSPTAIDGIGLPPTLSAGERIVARALSPADAATYKTLGPDEKIAMLERAFTGLIAGGVPKVETIGATREEQIFQAFGQDAVDLLQEIPPKHQLRLQLAALSSIGDWPQSTIANPESMLGTREGIEALAKATYGRAAPYLLAALEGAPAEVIDEAKFHTLKRIKGEYGQGHPRVDTPHVRPTAPPLSIPETAVEQVALAFGDLVVPLFVQQQRTRPEEAVRTQLDALVKLADPAKETPNASSLSLEELVAAAYGRAGSFMIPLLEQIAPGERNHIRAECLSRLNQAPPQLNHPLGYVRY